MASLKFSEIFSFAWSFSNGKLVELYRHYFSEVVTVVTKSGSVKGYKLPSSFDYQYINFFGIPYAKPPVGDLRFKVVGNIEIVVFIYLFINYLLTVGPTTI